MSPPTILDPHGLVAAAQLDPDLAQMHGEVVNHFNATVTRVLDPLAALAHNTRADKNLSQHGQLDALQHAAAAATRGIEDALESKLKAVNAWRHDAERDLQDALQPSTWHVDLLAEVRADVRELVHLQPATPPDKLMRDADGRPILTEGVGARLAGLLADLLHDGNEESAKLMILGLHTSNPVGKLTLGGRDVVRELRRRLAKHVAPEPTAELERLDRLTSILNGNAQIAHDRARKLLGLGPKRRGEDTAQQRAAGAGA